MTIQPKFFNQYFFDERVETLGVRLLGCGHYDRTMFKAICTPRRLGCYGLVMLLDGEGTFVSASANKTEVLHGGDVLLLFPDDWHLYNPRDDADWHEYWFLFEGATVDDICRQGHFKKDVPIIRPSSRGFLEKEASTLLHKAHHGHHQQLHEIPLGLLSLLGQLKISSIPQQQEQSGVSALLEQIRNDPAHDWDFHRIAQENQWKYDVLRKKITEATGLPPRRFLNTLRMQLSSQYLLNGASVQQAANKVGIEDAYYYSRLFKSIMGTAPSNFCANK